MAETSTHPIVLDGPNSVPATVVAEFFGPHNLPAISFCYRIGFRRVHIVAKNNY